VPIKEPAVVEAGLRVDAAAAPLVPPAAGSIAGVIALEPAGLLVVGTLVQSGSTLEASLVAKDGKPSAAQWCVTFPRNSAAADAEPTSGFVALFRGASAESDARVRLQRGTTVIVLDPGTAESRSRLEPREVLKDFWRACRAELKTRVAAIPAELLSAVSAGDSSLANIRINVDHCLELGGGRFFLDGWLLAPPETTVYFADETSGVAVPLSSTWERTERPDVVQSYREIEAAPRDCGFVAYATVAASEKLAAPVLFFAGTDGSVTRHPLQPRLPSAQHSETVQSVLGSFPAWHARPERIADQIGPALTAVLARERSERRPDPRPHLRWYGESHPDPKASIIIPLWGSLDLIRHQLAILGTAPQASSREVIFALDDPSLQSKVAEWGEDWLRLYGVPYGVLDCGGNVGFLRIVNFTARAARGDVLVLMHSDVLPDQPDWLERGLRVLDGAPDCGLLGPKLLFEDGMVQSEGVLRKTQACAELVEPMLAGHGQPDISPVRAAFDVEALSSACLFVRRQLFLDLEGFSEDYLLGHEYAEFDLCLRARQLGARCLLDPSITMRHLEGQSMTAFVGTQPLLGDPAWRKKVRLYNAWKLGKLAGAIGPRRT
jgi:GT2 family glycosyltransferase